MNRLQKIGGIAALVEVGTFIVGFVLYFSVLASANYGSLDIGPLIHVRFLNVTGYNLYLLKYVTHPIPVKFLKNFV